MTDDALLLLNRSTLVVQSVRSRPVSARLPAADQADLIVRGARVSEANDAAASLLGCGRGFELVGRSLAEVLACDAQCLRSDGA